MKRKATGRMGEKKQESSTRKAHLRVRTLATPKPNLDRNEASVKMSLNLCRVSSFVGRAEGQGQVAEPPTKVSPLKFP